MEKQYQFGDVFLAGYQNALQRKQQEEQFNKQMDFNKRQQSFYEVITNRKQGFEEDSFAKKFGEEVKQNAFNNKFAEDKLGAQINQWTAENILGRDKLNADTELDNARLSLQNVMNKRDVGLGYSKLAQDQEQFRESMNYKMNSNYSDKPLGLDSIDVGIRYYDKNVGLSPELRDEKFNPEGWRATMYKDMDKIFEDAGMGQSIWDAVYNNAGISPKDTPAQKRTKLKKTIEANKDSFNPNQVQVLYKKAEVMTR